jgi:translocation and assembly module TamB
MRYLAVCIALLAPFGAQAQSSDPDFLTALLQDNLSGAGRQVVITGFEGALSSQARIETLTIADEAGVWISLSGIVLDWQRSDLLRGRLTVNTLSAAEINLMRMPQAQGEITAEAPSFSLPNLPLSVDIGSVSTPKLVLGAPILGEAVTAQIDAKLTLDAGNGTGSLQLARTDAGAPSGFADISVSFSNATRALMIDITAREDAGGIISRVMGIPAAPALELEVLGDGPLDQFAARLDLRSNGAQRLGGTVTLQGQTNAGEAAQTQFVADFAGDIAPLLQPQFRPFFGDRQQISARGQTRAEGGFSLEQLAVTSAAMQIEGALDVDAAGLPQRFSLNGVLRDASGAPLVLPLALNLPAAITEAKISANYDAALGEDWSATATLQGWQQSDLRIAMVDVRADGSIARAPSGADFLANLNFSAEGVQPARMSVARALGSTLWGSGAVSFGSAGGLALQNLQINGEDYGLLVDGRLGGLASGGEFIGKLQANAANLGRLSDILGRPVSGAAALGYLGSFTLLTGAFDGEVTGTAQDLALGLRSLDSILRGKTALNITAKRDEKGVNLAEFTLAAAGFDLNLAGQVAGSNSDLTGSFALRDQPIAQRGFAGAATGSLRMTGALNDAVVEISAQTQGISVNNARLDPLLGAPAALNATVALRDFAPHLSAAQLTSPNLKAQAVQGAGGAFDISASMENLGLIFPEFPGQVAVTGTVTPREGGAQTSLNLRGPAGLDVAVSGMLTGGQSNDLSARGVASAGLINAFIAPRSLSGSSSFDLTLRGALALPSLAGTVTLENGRLADPKLPFGLQNINARADLAAGRASIDAAAVSNLGGSLALAGTVDLPSPRSADLSITLRDFGLRDPKLYQTSASGALAYNGVIGGPSQISGTIVLGRTEVQLRVAPVVQDTALPDLIHIGEPADVQRTRARAGMLAVQVAQPQAPIALNITVQAANRLFLRGRGLDAELGGQLRLLGTTADVRPSGAFDLVQGRFEVLGKRLDLEEVRLELQGQLVPFLSLRAVNLQDDVLTTVLIDGPAIDPAISFTASPDMPEEEVIAQLLFDQNLSSLSPLQAVQLGSAVATLIGRGDGVVARIRTMLQLDNLDIQTDPAGQTALKLGKYVSDKVYSEVSIDGAGTQALDFSLDVTQALKLRAGAGTSGSVGIGLELETNY